MLIPLPRLGGQEIRTQILAVPHAQVVSGGSWGNDTMVDEARHLWMLVQLGS